MATFTISLASLLITEPLAFVAVQRNSLPSGAQETPPRVWGRQISHLSARREQLEAQNASLWNSFKGLEPYQAEGRTYLLTPAGQQIVNAGKVGQRDAWEVVRR